MNSPSYEMKSKIVSFFADIRIYWFGFILFGDSHYKIKGPHMREILEALEPGDVLLRRYDNYLGTFFIKGHFSHAAIYMGDDKIIHMLGEGIVEEDILTFMRCDDIVILRCQDSATTQAAMRNAETALTMGPEYDFDFDSKRSDKMYCTEFVDNCFGYPVRSKKGLKHIILPDDFLELEAFSIIWRKK
jgi:uncharacterized protein YycO